MDAFGTQAQASKAPEEQPTKNIGSIFYEPWYYSRTRPVLNALTGPPDPLYGTAPLMHRRDTRSPFVVEHYRPIAKFALIRPGSVTHAFNSDQRYIELESRLSRPPSISTRPDFRLNSSW